MSTVYEVLPHEEVESPEWHAQRARGIGASDVAAILGLSPWATPLSIYRQKMGVHGAHTSGAMGPLVTWRTAA